MPRKKIGSRSIGSRQMAYLKTMELEDIGTDKYDTTSLDTVERLLLDFATVFSETAVEGLEALHNVNTGDLINSIGFSNVEHHGGRYSVEIEVLDYFKYINEGVRGTKAIPEGAQGSPFQFKNGRPSRKMALAIRKWLIREGLKANSTPARKRPIGQEHKGKRALDITERSEDMSYAVAAGIKKNGIKGSHFWDKAQAKTLEEIKKQGTYTMQVILIRELASKK